jgi:hypothetical protein
VLITDATQAALDEWSVKLYKKSYNELSELELETLVQQMISTEETSNIEGAFV